MTTSDPDPGWDVTDAANPQPRIWPQCVDCGTPFVYRRFISLAGGYRWAWSQDCKHDRRRKQPMVVPTSVDGPVGEPVQL